MREIIADGETGFLVSGVDEAVAAVGRLDEISRPRCRSVAEDRFSAERMVRDYLDVYRRVLVLIKPNAFQACFANWLQSLRTTAAEATGVTQPILAVDGKTARQSHDRGKGLGALHSVSVWASGAKRACKALSSVCAASASAQSIAR